MRSIATAKARVAWLAHAQLSPRLYWPAERPLVIDNTGRAERSFDIYSLLLRERIVFLGSPIDDQIANLVVAQLLYLDPDTVVSADQAVAYGLADEVLEAARLPLRVGT